MGAVPKGAHKNVTSIAHSLHAGLIFPINNLPCFVLYGISVEVSLAFLLSELNPPPHDL